MLLASRLSNASVYPAAALALILAAGSAVGAAWAQPEAQLRPGLRAIEKGEPQPPSKPGSYAVIDGKRAPIPAVPMGDAGTLARIVDEGKNRNQVMEHLSHLSTKIGPRLTGSENLDKANKWTRDQFAKWGLTLPPLDGSKGETSPDADLRGLWQWTEVPVRFDRGPSFGRVVTVRNPGGETAQYRTLRDMEFTTQAWTMGTSGLVRGNVIKMPENDEQLAAVKDKVKGSWILIKPAQGGRRGVLGSSGVRLTNFAEIRKRWKEGKMDGAPVPTVDKDLARYEGTMAGGPTPEGSPFTLDVKLTDPKAVTGTISAGGFRTSEIMGGTFDPATRELKFRTESTRGNRDYVFTVDGDTVTGKTALPNDAGTIAYTGKKVAIEQPRKGPAMEEKLLALEPAGWISPSGSELVITSGAQGWSTMSLDNVTPDIIVTVRQSDYDCMNSRLADGQPVEAEFDLQQSLKKGPFPVYNTIAEIKGTEKPDEVVIVSGHLDSWNGPNSQGTTDNGTGSAVTMEAARILMAANAKPKRTIRFILWTGEEQGLLGSAAYVKALKERGQLENVSTVLVDDGGTNYEGGLGCVAGQVDYLAAATAPVNGHFFSDADGKFLDVNIHAMKVFTQVGGSDHSSFTRERIPGFFWDEVGRADYNYTHHTQYDKLDQAIPEYLRQSATCAAVTAYNLACAPEKLPRPLDEEWPQRGGGGGGQRRPGGAAGGGAGGNERPAGGGGAGGAGQ